MFLHNAVFLTPSKSPSLAHLPSCKYFAPITALFSAGLQLFKRVHISLIPKTLAFLCFHTLAHSFAFSKDSTLLFSCDSELFAQNTRGGGALFLEPFQFGKTLRNKPIISANARGAAFDPARPVGSLPKETFLRRPSTKHEVPSNPLRCAGAPSVPKTACLAPCSRFSSQEMLYLHTPTLLLDC